MAWNSINCLVFPGRMLLLKSGDNSLNINYSTTDSTMSLLGNDPHWMYLQLLTKVCGVSLKTFTAFHGAFHTIWMQFVWEGTLCLLSLDCQWYPCVYTAPEGVTAGSRETPRKSCSPPQKTFRHSNMQWILQHKDNVPQSSFCLLTNLWPCVPQEQLNRLLCVSGRKKNQNSYSIIY